MIINLGPVFRGFCLRCEARPGPGRWQRQLEGDIAAQNFAQTRNTIRLEVETAYNDLKANFENIDTTRLAVEQAKKALDIAIVRFDADVGTQLDILAAQSQLTEAEANLVATIAGYNRSLARLQRAVSSLAGVE